jgi:hypothetical protein
MRQEEMADAPSADPTPDPTPAPAPAPAPTPDPAPTPTPGWKTSEAWISFIVIVLGAVPSSGLTDNSPTLAKIVGLVIAALSALNYTYQRSALKRAYVAAHAARTSVSIVRSPQLAAAATILLVLLSVSGLCALSSCGAAASCQDPKNASSAECAIVDAAVDCTGVSSLPTAVATVEPIVVKLLASAKQADGSINWAGIEGQLVDIALQYGPCVLANVWTNLMGSGAHAVEVAGAKLAPDDLKKEFDRIRARVAPGRTFNVGAGRKL